MPLGGKVKRYASWRWAGRSICGCPDRAKGLVCAPPSAVGFPPRPQPWHDGNLTFFRLTETFAMASEGSSRPALGWREWVSFEGLGLPPIKASGAAGRPRP